MRQFIILTAVGIIKFQSKITRNTWQPNIQLRYSHNAS